MLYVCVGYIVLIYWHVTTRKYDMRQRFVLIIAVLYLDMQRAFQKKRILWLSIAFQTQRFIPTNRFSATCLLEIHTFNSVPPCYKDK